MGSGGGKKGGGKVRIVRYYMTIHYAICHGPVERLRRIVIKEKDAWKGLAGGETEIDIDKLDLFGGDLKEGGARGTVHYQKGDWTQLVAAKLAARFGLTPSTMPGYRGIATAGFRAPDGKEYQGFQWTANTPYIPPVAFEVSRIPRDWEPGLAGVAREEVGYWTTTWDDIRRGVTQSNDPLVWDTPISPINRSINVASFRDPDYIMDTADPWASNSPYCTLYTDHSTGDGPPLTAGLSFTVSRGPYDVPSLPPGETAWCYDAGVGKKVVIEFVSMPGRFFEFEITWVNPTNRQITLVNQNQCIYRMEAEYTGYEVDSIDGSGPGGFSDSFDADEPRDMNPAHIIRECLTDEVWGLGLPTSLIDNDSFVAAATTLYTEAFGLSMLWVRQTETHAFIAEVLDHIKGMLYPDPRTGKFVLRLIRDDYDPDDLDTLDPSNADLRTFARRSPSEVVNEIQVTWTNPENEEESVVVMQDLGAIVAANGEITTDTRGYYGVRNKALAARLAARDIAEVTAPLATAEATVDRSAWDFTPGDVAKLDWPEYGAEGLVMRVMRVNYGRPGDSKITLSLTEDIFAYQQMEPVEPDDTEAIPFGGAAEAPDPVEFMSTPLWFVLQEGAEAPDDDEAYVAILPRTDVFDTISSVTESEGTGATGSTEWQEVGELDVIAAAVIGEDWDAEAETVTTVPFTGFTAGIGPEPGGLAILGAEGLAEDDQEIVAFTDVDVDGHHTVRRGILDTVPRTWASGATIRFLSPDASFADTLARGVGVGTDYRLRTRTSLGLLPVADAALDSYTPTDRIHAPARPANVQAEGVGFGGVNASGLTEIEVTWSNRNRLTEETVLLAWDAATVTPEAGQTTTLTLIDDGDDSVIDTITGLTGTSHDIPVASFDDVTAARVRVTSERDGITSIQGHEITIRFAGYGLSYGYSYGG